VSYDDDDDDEKPGFATIQYTMVNGVYVRCGATMLTVPAGFYKVQDATGYGNYGLKAAATASDDLIDIPGTVADEIFVDIDQFLAVKESYRKFGLTHKRGYLFYGPPGSGKTSLAMMLAKRFITQANGLVVYIDDDDMLVAAVNLLRDVEPGRPVMYLIEEADMIVDSTQCLSILDGEMSVAGAVFVAMTNYKEDLPPRIANRPGRFDRVVKVDCPPEAVQVEYLKRVYARDPDATLGKPTPEVIVKALRGLPVSMGHLREAFIATVLLGVDVAKLRKRFDEMSESEEGDEDWDDDDDGFEEMLAEAKRATKKGRKRRGSGKVKSRKRK